MSKPERQHIIDAFAYEVGHVKNKDVKQRVADMFSNVDLEMAKAFAIKIGVAPPVSGVSANETIAKSSPALSQENTPKSALSRKVAVVIADGFDYNQVKSVMNALQKEGAQAAVVSDTLGMISSTDGTQLEAMHTFITHGSVAFDAVYVDGGQDASSTFEMDASNFIKEAYKHYKPIAGTNEGKTWIENEKMSSSDGVFLDDSKDFENQFIQGITTHRFWERVLI